MKRSAYHVASGVQAQSYHALSAKQTARAWRVLLTIGGYFLGLVLALLPMLANAQTQSEIQYTYDAAGKLIGVTRASNKPDLTVTNLSVGTITTACNGSFLIPVSFQVNNVGSVAANATWYDYGYLSANTTLHDTDQVLGGYTTRSTNLAAGANYTVSTTYTTSTTTPAGNWYLMVKADGGAAASGQFSPTGPNHVDELNEYNNTQVVAVTLPGNPLPDLTVSSASVGAITESQNGSYSFPVTFTVKNISGSTAQPTWYDLAYLSTNGVLDNNSVNLAGFNTRSTALACGSSYTVMTTYSTTTTQATGSYTLFIKADGRGTAIGAGTNTDAGYVAESNEANNTRSLAITLPARPDLTVSNSSIGAITVNQNGSYSFPATYTVKNIGGSAAQPTWYDQAFLSTNGVLDNNSVNLSGFNTRSTALAAGASYTVTTTFSTTPTQATGSYSLFIKADAHSATPTDNGNVAEANENNNTQKLSLTLPVRPDLTLSNASIGAITVNQNGSYSFPATYTVKNIGGSAAQPTWYDQAFLSTNGVLDNNSVNLSGFNTRSTALAAGASYTVTTTFTTSTTQATGSYTLFLKADAHSATPTDNGNVIEANENNNTEALSLTLPVRPDLTVSNFTVGTIVKNGDGSYSIPASFQVNNIGGAAAQPTWYDQAFLSSNGVLDNSSVNLSGFNTRSTALAAGTSYTVNITFTTSTTQAAGSYTLFVKADAHSATPTDSGNVIEANETNNTASQLVVLP